MRIFFDMDHTLISDCGVLRPRVREVFELLTADAHEIYIWSGVGLRWQEVNEHKLSVFVRDCFRKPIKAFDTFHEATGGVVPDLVVDDVAAVVDEFGGVVIRPYYWDIESDREMERVYRILQEVASTGNSAERAFRPGRRRSNGR